MKRLTTIYLLAVLTMLAACTGTSETTITLYGDAAITSFTLGNVNRYQDGVKSTFSASSYAFCIDHLKHEIYNTDSLPTGSDIQHIVCSVTAPNNGQVMIEHDEKGDTLDFYSSTDSIDFSRTRYFRVYASDGSGYTRYKVSVNVHQQEGDKVTWRRMADIPVMSGLRAVCHGGVLYVVGNEGGQLRAYASTDGGATWVSRSLPAVFTDADVWSSLSANNDSIYILNGQKVYYTSDMTSWAEDNNELPDGITLKQFLGAGSAELYALTTDNDILARYTDFYWWYTDNRDDSNELPTQDFASVVYPLNLSDSTDVVLLAGNRQTRVGDKDVWQTVFWRKIFDYSETGAISNWIQTGNLGGEWVYMDRAGDTEYELPAMRSPQLLRYDGVLLALGAAAYGETEQPACSVMYKSRDNGITWKPDGGYAMPPRDAGTGAVFDTSATCIAATVDGEDNIWIFAAGTGEVWRGRLNRLGWEK